MPRFVKKNGISIYYEIVGNLQSSETIVLIGGLTRDHTIWRKVIPFLQQNYRIIMPDNRDAGQSSTSPSGYGISELAEDVSDLIYNLGLGAVHVVGHSMGGFMSIHIAAKHPELIKSAILCSTAEKQTTEGIAYLKERIKRMDDMASPSSRMDIIATMEKIYAPQSLLDKEFVEEIVNFEIKNPYSQSAKAFKRQAKACINHDASSLVKNVKTPVLVVTGEYDKAYPPEIAKNLVEKFSDAKLEIIPLAGHMIQLEQSKLLSHVLEKFIQMHLDK